MVTNVSEEHIASIYPEDEDVMFLRNVGNHLQDCTVSQPRGLYDPHFHRRENLKSHLRNNMKCIRTSVYCNSVNSVIPKLYRSTRTTSMKDYDSPSFIAMNLQSVSWAVSAHAGDLLMHTYSTESYSDQTNTRIADVSKQTTIFSHTIVYNQLFISFNTS
jgi:hypothetical protein